MPLGYVSETKQLNILWGFSLSPIVFLMFTERISGNKILLVKSEFAEVANFPSKSKHILFNSSLDSCNEQLLYQEWLCVVMKYRGRNANSLKQELSAVLNIWLSIFSQELANFNSKLALVGKISSVCCKFWSDQCANNVMVALQAIFFM